MLVCRTLLNSCDSPCIRLAVAAVAAAAAAAHDDDDLVLLQRILKVDYQIPGHIKLSPEGHDLLKRVLVTDPAQRITVQVWNTRPQHPQWVTAGHCAGGDFDRSPRVAASLQGSRTAQCVDCSPNLLVDFGAAFV
jgi:hypothetical protein